MSHKPTNIAQLPTSLLEKYAGSYPRYTSYPTAPQLRTGYSSEDYAKQAELSNQTLIPRDLSVYVHLPFCHSLCYFCGCNKVVTRHNSPKVADYLKCLLAEINLRASLFDSDRKVSQIHFGGGTPNFFSPSELSHILQKIAEAFNLHSPGELEVGIEIDPRSTDANQISDLIDAGFNRFSIGVQDFSKDVQTAINRVQSEQATLDVIKAAQTLGNSASVDLITGLPRQTLISFRNTLDKIIETKVGRICAYNFAYLPDRIKPQKLINPTQLPNLRERLDLVQSTRDALQAAAYTHIGVDHFAKPDDPLAVAFRDNTLQRNFQGYTTHSNTDLVGVGASAISQFRGSISQNATELSDYKAQIKNNQLPIVKGLNLSSDDLIRAHVVQQLMCRDSLDLSLPINELGEGQDGHTLSEYFTYLIPRLKHYEHEGLISLAGDALQYTEMGHFFRRQIAATFDAYLTPNPENQSVAKQNVIRFSGGL